jgi:hypothetical protein
VVDAELRHPRMHRAKRRRSSRRTESRLAHPTLDEVNGSPVTLVGEVPIIVLGSAGRLAAANEPS